MKNQIEHQAISSYVISDWIESFLTDRRAKSLSPHTVRYYKQHLTTFLRFALKEGVDEVTSVNADLLRRFLLHLAETGHNKGGIAGHYRAFKAFFTWFQQEVEPDEWRNPVQRVAAPRVPLEILDPVAPETIRAMLGVCRGTGLGPRDRALILTLLDTGARVSELCAMDVADLDIATGHIHIRHGKGDRGRIVFVGPKTLRAIRLYLRARRTGSTALWINRHGDRLTLWGVHQLLERRASSAHVPRPSCHSFRRAFCLNMLRAGANIYSIMAISGHKDAKVLERYLKISQTDAEDAHKRFSPVSSLLG